MERTVAGRSLRRPWADERVLVLTLVRGRGRASGLDFGKLRARSAQVFHVRSDKVTRVVVWIDGERALADLGLTS